MNTCPCKDCVPPKRHPACHGTCSEFYEYNEERLGIKRVKRNAKKQDDMIDAYVISQNEKYLQRKTSQYAYKKMG